MGGGNSMSKIALSGNASGTGIFTIASPNGNTDRTLTLPDNTGTILTTATAGVPVNGPAFSAYQSAGTVLSNGVSTKVACNTEIFDTNSNYNTATYVFQPTVAGYYQVQAAISPTATLAGGFIVPILYKNGSAYREGVAAPSYGRTTVVALIYLNGSSDYVELYVYNGSGASVTLAQPSKDTAFEAAMIRSA
jgi:hypothetical protein